MKNIRILDNDKNGSGRHLSLKYIRLTTVFLAFVAMLASCEFLDYNETEQYKKQDMLMEVSRMKSILTNIYSYLPNDFSSVGGAMRASASDDAEHVWDISDIQKFNDGSWNSIVKLDDVWGRMYRGIRTANIFLEEAPGLTFDDIKYNEGYSETMAQYEIYPYEARFLRAFYYFELIKRYGDIPLITTILTEEEANNVTPASFDDIVEFIVTECDESVPHLQATYSTFFAQETGRATKGAALALKARTLLYAASPLHNPSNDQAKWARAARAAKDLIDQFAAQYSPLPTYANAVNVLTSRELIFERREATARYFEEANTAIGFTGGNTGTCPTQNLVDAYEVKVNATTAIPFDWNNPAHAAAPYANRDPRLASTVLYNGSIWKTPQIVETWYGGLNAPPKANATKTGYYLKKYMVESISLNPINASTAIHYWVIFRYGEVLLNYAEAMNEAFGPEVAGPAPLDNLTALQAVNVVRTRATMPGFPVGMTQAAFRDRLRNERRVELAFEDHRFWDIRRWKIGSTTTSIYGVDVTKVDNVLTYVPKLVETRVWDDKMNLYPIPQTEIFINGNLEQNQGW